ncbi:hypothetical protein RAG00_27885, partial [Klebsiella variicola subsp. variicola]
HRCASDDNIHGQEMFKTMIQFPNHERTTDDQKKRVGYFVFHNDQWWLVNEGLSGLISLPDRKTVGIGEKLLLEDNTQFILSSEDGGRLVVVQLLNN